MKYIRDMVAEISNMTISPPSPQLTSCVPVSNNNNNNKVGTALLLRCQTLPYILPFCHNYHNLV